MTLESALSGNAGRAVATSGRLGAMTESAFGGEVSEYYQRFRRGYPPAVADALTTSFALTREDVVLDLGCGTGQLTRVLASRVGAVLGMDPEPDMLAQARRATSASNVSWLLGADADVEALTPAVGPGRLAAVTVAQALHWMDHDRLFTTARSLLRPGGGVAVVTNGEPLWLQDSAWSAALRELLSSVSGSPLHRTCGTDSASQKRYAEALSAAGYAVDPRPFRLRGADGRGDRRWRFFGHEPGAAARGRRTAGVHRARPGGVVAVRTTA